MTNYPTFRTSRQRRAFSLIELLVTIAIIGVLITIGIAVGFKVFDSSKASDTAATQARVMNVIQRYYEIEGEWPGEDSNHSLSETTTTVELLKDLLHTDDPDNDYVTKDMLQNDAADALEKNGADWSLVDAWGNEMEYTSKGLGGQPALISAGADGEFGTDDDIRSDADM
jgi:prepilin-type N-terminal cleavage/methylation domain-containing protein